MLHPRSYATAGKNNRHGSTSNLVRARLILGSLVTLIIRSLLECFTSLCTVFADTSAVKRTPKRGLLGTTYYTQSFDIVLMCGLTELQAQIRWKENVSILTIFCCTHR